MENKKKPHTFCETPEEGCTMNYCDENGCLNRERNYVEEGVVISMKDYQNNKRREQIIKDIIENAERF